MQLYSSSHMFMLYVQVVMFTLQNCTIAHVASWLVQMCNTFPCPNLGKVSSREIQQNRINCRIIFAQNLWRAIIRACATNRVIMVHIIMNVTTPIYRQGHRITCIVNVRKCTLTMSANVTFLACDSVNSLAFLLCSCRLLWYSSASTL